MLNTSASKIINGFHNEQKHDANDVKHRIIKAAAKLILSDIKNFELDNS